jgi:hypothetical protein
MANLTDYFNRKEQPRARFKYGDRVFGRKEKTPFVGTVQREIGSMVMIHTDLPLQFEGNTINIVTAKRTDIIRLVEF